MVHQDKPQKFEHPSGRWQQKRVDPGVLVEPFYGPQSSEPPVGSKLGKYLINTFKATLSDNSASLHGTFSFYHDPEENYEDRYRGFASRLANFRGSSLRYC